MTGYGMLFDGCQPGRLEDFLRTYDNKIADDLEQALLNRNEDKWIDTVAPAYIAEMLNFKNDSHAFTGYAADEYGHPACVIYERLYTWEMGNGDKHMFLDTVDNIFTNVRKAILLPEYCLPDRIIHNINHADKPITVPTILERTHHV